MAAAIGDDEFGEHDSFNDECRAVHPERFLQLKALIVIPAYNEEDSLPKTLESLEPLGDDYEVVVINDGSRDRTAQVARKFAEQSSLKIHVVSLPKNRGIGAAVQTGYLFAVQRGGYDYAIQFDADGQHDAEGIPSLIRACEEQKLDLCVGSRFLEGGKDNFRSTFSRRLGIRFLAKLISMLSGVKVTDPTSGFRCAGRLAYTAFANRYPDDYPEPESMYWCARNHLKIGEIPARMFSRTAGVSSIRFTRGAYYMSKVTLAIAVDRIRKREKFRS